MTLRPIIPFALQVVFQLQMRTLRNFFRQVSDENIQCVIHRMGRFNALENDGLQAILHQI